MEGSNFNLFPPLLQLVLLVLSVFSVGILAIAVYKNNPRSATNLIFASLSLTTMLWLLSTYVSYLPQFSSERLLFARLAIFFAAPQSLLFFFLAYTMPSEKMTIPRIYRYILYFFVGIIMILNLSPYAFTSVDFSENFSKQRVGMGIIPFVFSAVFFSFLAVLFLLKKLHISQGMEKQQFKFVLIGILLMLGFVVATVLVPIVFFESDIFVPMVPVYTLFFLGMTGYAIIKHHLFELKVVATEALTAIIWITLISKIIISESFAELIVNSLIFSITLIFGFLLIKSVRKEVEQRQKLEQLNKELEEAKLKLEDLSRFKTQLLSLASHQIKSPLAAIKGFISIMLQGLYGPIEPKIRETLEKMKHSSDELIDLINSVLDLRKVEEGKMEYSFERVSLTAMVKGVVEEIQPLATGKGLKLESVLPANEIFVQADKTKLKQVVQNLVDNSIKYTLEGFVRASLKEEDGPAGKEVVFSVTDSGLGLSETLLPHLFAEFVRDDRVKKEIRGTGFGLYIAKNIIEAHGGKIWAESPGEGKGSTFAVRLKEV